MTPETQKVIEDYKSNKRLNDIIGFSETKDIIIDQLISEIELQEKEIEKLQKSFREIKFRL